MVKRAQWLVVASEWTNKRARRASHLRLAEPRSRLAFHSAQLTCRENLCESLLHLVGPNLDFELTRPPQNQHIDKNPIPRIEQQSFLSVHSPPAVVSHEAVRSPLSVAFACRG